ncbi:MAG: ABC transporter permease [Holophagaceae bacterium]|nr:ABC transporter permease [Holophagaceae bacterium]
MLKKIIIHETLLNLTSFRFHLIVGLFVLLFFGGLAVNVSNYKARLAEYTETMAQGDQNHIAVPPNPMGVFAEGMDRYSSMSVSLDSAIVGLIDAKSLGKDNASLRLSAFETLDFNFAIRVILSLGAIIITFASVSGERFAGTLKLASASGLAKRHIILGKIVASFFCLAIPLAICVAIACIILAINNMLTAQIDIVRVGFFFLFSLVYILFFLLLGVTISIATRRPQESLVTGVLFWMLFVFIVPSLIPQAAKLFADLPSTRAMEEVRKHRWVGTLFENENSNASPERDRARAFQQLQDDNEHDWEKSRNQLNNYSKIKRRFDLLSPADIYNDASMEVLGNGLQNALHAKKSILQHKDNVLKDAANSSFAFQRLGFVSDLTLAMISMLFLCLEVCILLVIAYRKFLSLDLREG